MGATLDFIANTILTIGNFIYTNPVCSVGLVAVTFNLIAWVFEHVKKLL